MEPKPSETICPSDPVELNEQPGGARRRAQVIGTGLIGGSVALALQAQGWFVTGSDTDARAEALALELGAINAVGLDRSAEVCFVALPVGLIADAANELLAMDDTDWVVTDVGSVKASIAEAVRHPRFIGGHPMAGSEIEGVRGSRADMFAGATWVLTPSETTDPLAHILIHTIVAGFDAEILTLAPDLHDRLVAM
ncbi:MAG: prephenate dehydrogenase/arogenate dehydrogenase family protein, partial [Actinobacteria bacterium]|nr:prephenate dehydrogenase/arogenate dehydrogenase family protein [Actinomycetota bacterium]